MISNAELTSTKEYERPSLSEEDGQSQPFLRQNATGPQLRPRKNEKRLYLSIFACVGLIYTMIWMSIAWYAAEYITSYKSAISKLQRYCKCLISYMWSGSYTERKKHLSWRKLIWVYTRQSLMVLFSRLMNIVKMEDLIHLSTTHGRRWAWTTEL